jgi:TP901 family phage tail tape measure protein
MQRTVGRFTRSATRGLRAVGRVSDKVAAGIKQGFMAAAVAMAAFGGAAAKVISIGADFEQKITSAAVKFPGKIRKGSEAFKELEDVARRTGATTEFSATQSAEALTFLAMAGLDAEQSIAALPGVVDLATAAGIELGQATDIATDALGAFGLVSKDATQTGINLARVNDVLASTTTSANTTMEDMYEAIKEGASVSTRAGASIETFSALVGEMANAGIKGSKAGTTLKNVFLNLQAPAAAGRKALARIGLKTTEKGKLKDVVKLFGELQGKLKKFGAAKQASILKDIFGKIALPGVAVLLNSGSAKLEQFREKLLAAKGSAAEMAAVMRDTTAGAIDSLKSALEGVIISIFKLEDDGIKNTINRMTDWVRLNEKLIVSKIGEWLNMLIDNFKSIVKWTGRILKGAAAFFVLHKAIKLVIGVMAVVNALMAMNPIGLVVIAIAALVAGLIAVVHWSKEVAKFFDEMPFLIKAVVFAIAPLTAAIWGIAKLAEVIKENWQPIENEFKVLVEAVKMTWEPIGEFFDELWDGIVVSFDDAIQKIKQILEPVAEWIKGVFQPVTDFIEENISNPVGSFIDENISGPLGGLYDDMVGDNINQARRHVAMSEEAKLDALPTGISDENIELLRLRSENSSSNATVTIKTAEGTEVESTEGSFGGLLKLIENGG